MLLIPWLSSVFIRYYLLLQPRHAYNFLCHSLADDIVVRALTLISLDAIVLLDMVPASAVFNSLMAQELYYSCRVSDDDDDAGESSSDDEIFV